MHKQTQWKHSGDYFCWQDTTVLRARSMRHSSVVLEGRLPTTPVYRISVIASLVQEVSTAMKKPKCLIARSVLLGNYSQNISTLCASWFVNNSYSATDSKFKHISHVVNPNMSLIWMHLLLNCVTQCNKFIIKIVLFVAVRYIRKLAKLPMLLKG